MRLDTVALDKSIMYITVEGSTSGLPTLPLANPFLTLGNRKSRSAGGDPYENIDWIRSGGHTLS